MAASVFVAVQLYHTLTPLLEKLGVRCALLTASTKAKTRRSILEQLAAGEIALAIGTHALLSPAISYQTLGLVVPDAQRWEPRVRTRTCSSCPQRPSRARWR